MDGRMAGLQKLCNGSVKQDRFDAMSNICDMGYACSHQSDLRFSITHVRGIHVAWAYKYSPATS